MVVRVTYISQKNLYNNRKNPIAVRNRKKDYGLASDCDNGARKLHPSLNLSHPNIVLPLIILPFLQRGQTSPTFTADFTLFGWLEGFLP